MNGKFGLRRTAQLLLPDSLIKKKYILIRKQNRVWYKKKTNTFTSGSEINSSTFSRHDTALDIDKKYI
jgi:hypothetical protein